MPRAPRGKRAIDPKSGSWTVIGRVPNGEPEPYFDKTRVSGWRPGVSPTAASDGLPARRKWLRLPHVIAISLLPRRRLGALPWLRGSRRNRRLPSCPVGGSTTWPATGCG